MIEIVVIYGNRLLEITSRRVPDDFVCLLLIDQFIPTLQTFYSIIYFNMLMGMYDLYFILVNKRDLMKDLAH